MGRGKGERWHARGEQVTRWRGVTAGKTRKTDVGSRTWRGKGKAQTFTHPFLGGRAAKEGREYVWKRRTTGVKKR